MSEKVLGFKRKDANWRCIGDEGLEWHHFRIADDKLVSVRLASESVELEKLRDYCNKRISGTDTSWDAGYVQALSNLLSWAEKEAKK